MALFKKRKLALILLLIAVLLSGLVLGFLLGRNTSWRDLFYKKDLYKSSCAIYINASNNDIGSALSSTNLSEMIELPDAILDLENIYTAIGHGEYKLILERHEATQVFYIVAISKSSENLRDICNKAADLLIKEINTAGYAFAAKRIDFASEPFLVD